MPPTACLMIQLPWGTLGISFNILSLFRLAAGSAGSPSTNLRQSDRHKPTYASTRMHAVVKNRNGMLDEVCGPEPVTDPPHPLRRQAESAGVGQHQIVGHILSSNLA